jgi:hypothetical protein
MSMTNPSPPGFVRTVEISDERFIQILNKEYANICAREEKNLERAKAMGEMLRSRKKQKKHGEWLPFIARSNLSEATAREWMRIAKHWDDVLADHVAERPGLGIRDALNIIAEANGKQQENSDGLSKSMESIDLEKPPCESSGQANDRKARNGKPLPPKDDDPSPAPPEEGCGSPEEEEAEVEREQSATEEDATTRKGGDTATPPRPERTPYEEGKKAMAGFGVIVRFLARFRLDEQHRDALNAISAAIESAAGLNGR